jgi:hypothetical protein
MMIQFDPNNIVVKLCLQGMAMEDQGKPEDASSLFLKAWKSATDDFERFIATYFVARHQNSIADRLKWLETSLQIALNLNDEAVKSALPTLFSNIAKCYEALEPSDKGPFYHGTKADLKIGDLLTPGGDSNYKPNLKMNHIYFTALVNGAGLAAALAQGDAKERIYIVEPLGKFENDPNVTDKKFPGNLTRSYRSQEPLKVIGEVTEWKKQMPDEIHNWREKLAKNKGEIIN